MGSSRRRFQGIAGQVNGLSSPLRICILTGPAAIRVTILDDTDVGGMVDRNTDTTSTGQTKATLGEWQRG